MVSSEILDVSIRSLYVAGVATLLASSWSLVLAFLLASKPRLRPLASILESLVGIPTVLVGLLLYMLLSREGPLGVLELLYTPQAIIIGEAVLVTPLVTSVAYRVLRESIETYGELALTLGASRVQVIATVLSESLHGVIASIVMGFSRAIGELGVALLVGGGIRGYTRTLTTAIALEVSRGRFEEAIAMGLVLVLIVATISITLRVVWVRE